MMDDQHKSIDLNLSVIGVLALAWLLVGLVQALHFHYYYHQPWSQSFLWSYRDWLLWLLISSTAYLLANPHLKQLNNQLYAALAVFFVAVICGFLQVFLIIVTDMMMAELGRPFWQDVSYLYQKRWFQNLLTFAVLWLFMHQLFAKFNKQRTAPTQSEMANTQQKIKVVDGKQQYWLESKNIYRLEVSGNYLCFFTTEGQRIARQTMKSMAEQLDQHGFLKISRSNLINTRCIKSITQSGSAVHVELTNGDTCKISRRYWHKIKHSINTPST